MIASTGPRPRSVARLLRALPAAVLAALVSAPVPAQSQQPAQAAAPAPQKAPANEAAEKLPSAKSFLQMVLKADDQKLRATPGFTDGVIARIMERRRSGEGYKDLAEFEKQTGIDHQRLLVAIEPYQDPEDSGKLERKPIPTPGAPGSAGSEPRLRAKSPAQRGAGAAEGAPPPTPPGGEGPIGGVRPHFYANLPGFEDLDKLDPAVKKEFLEIVNRDLCACGCEGETIAFCLVNDPGCPVVKARARKIYTDLLARTTSR